MGLLSWCDYTCFSRSNITWLWLSLSMEGKTPRIPNSVLYKIISILSEAILQGGWNCRCSFVMELGPAKRDSREGIWGSEEKRQKVAILELKLPVDYIHGTDHKTALLIYTNVFPPPSFHKLLSLLILISTSQGMAHPLHLDIIFNIHTSYPSDNVSWNFCFGFSQLTSKELPSATTSHPELE